MMHRALIARIVPDRHALPLIVLDQLPGYEYHPADLRRLARQLNNLANAADQGERGPVTCPISE